MMEFNGILSLALVYRWALSQREHSSDMIATLVYEITLIKKRMTS